MAWIPALMCIALLVALIRKSVDGETASNLGFLLKVMGLCIALVILVALLR